MASHWHQIGGDIGTKGAAALAYHFRCSQKEPHGMATPAYIVFDPDDNGLPDLLELVAEACALLRPEERWRVTFSTYAAGKQPSNLPCDWRFCLKDDLTFLTDRAKNKLRINLTDRTMLYAADDSKVPEYKELCDLAATGEPPRPANAGAPGHGGALTPAGGGSRSYKLAHSPSIHGTSNPIKGGLPSGLEFDHKSEQKRRHPLVSFGGLMLLLLLVGALVFISIYLRPAPERSSGTTGDGVRDLQTGNSAVEPVPPVDTADMNKRIQEQRTAQAASDTVHEATAGLTRSNQTETVGTAQREASHTTPAAHRTYRLIAELSPDTVPAKVASAEEAANHPFTVYCLTRNPLKAETGTYTPGYPSPKGGFSQASIRVSGKEKPLVSFDWVLYQSATGTVCHLYRPPGSQSITLPQTVTYAPGLTKVEFPELGALPSPLLEAFSTLGCLDLGLYAGAAPAQDKEPFFWREKLKLTDSTVTIPPGIGEAFKKYRDRIETSRDPLLNDYCVKRKALADKRQEQKALDASAKVADADLRRAAEALRSLTEASTRAAQEIERLDADAKAEREFVNELAKKILSAKSTTVALIFRQAAADEKNAQTAEERDKQKRFVAKLNQLAAKYVAIQSDAMNSSKDEKVQRRLETIRNHEFECVEIKKLSEAQQREFSSERSKKEHNQVTGKAEGLAKKKESESALAQAQAAADGYHAKLKALPAEVKNSEDELKQALRALEAGLPITATVIIDKPSNAGGPP
jgi:hypothetical protein